jgi:hypothetical protein
MAPTTATPATLAATIPAIAPALIGDAFAWSLAAAFKLGGHVSWQASRHRPKSTEPVGHVEMQVA